MSEFPADVQRLKPARRTIMRLYFEIRQKDGRSTFHIVRQISRELGYTLDTNGSNSHVMKVIREYFGTARQMGLSPAALASRAHGDDRDGTAM